MVIAATLVYTAAKNKKEGVAYKQSSQNNLPTVIHRRIKLDKEFSQPQKNEIIYALNQWRNSLHGLFDFSIVERELELITSDDRADTIIFLCAKNNDRLIKKLDLVEGNKIWGYAYYSKDNPAVILLIPDRIGGLHDFKNIALHEIGHVLGISHISDSAAVMSKYYSGMDKLTYTDLVAFFSTCVWDYKSVKYSNDPFWDQNDSKEYKSKKEKFKEVLAA